VRRLARVLFLLAVLAWAAALTPGLPAPGRRFLLLDRSPSAAGAARRRAQELGARPGFDPGRAFELRDRLRPWGSRASVGEATPLGAALEALRPRLRRGDVLEVHTDGRATDPLPPAAAWAGIQVLWEPLDSGPRILALEAPASWPRSGRLLLGVRLAGPDWERGRLDLQVQGLEAPAAEIRPLGAERAEILLGAAAAPEGPVRLRLAWVENGTERDRVLRWLGPPGAAVAALGPGVRAEEVLPPGWVRAEEAGTAPVQLYRAPGPLAGARPVPAGAVRLLASGRLEDWLAWPGEGPPPFEAAPPPGAGLEILLDRSGSMGEEEAGGRRPWDEALEAVTALARVWPEEAGFRVRPFGAVLGAALDPRRPEEAVRLREEPPFGPTRLEEVLEPWLAGLGPGETGVLVSDGEVPPAAREGVLGRLRAARAPLFLVPVGRPGALDWLREAGEVLGEAGLRERLLAAAARGLETGPERLLPEEEALWPLPETGLATGARDRMRLRPGWEPLLRDASGEVVAGLRRLAGGGLLAVAAVEPGPALLELAAALADEASAPRLRRAGGRVLLEGGGPGWQVREAGVEEAGAWRPLDPLGADLRGAGPFPPGAALELRSPAGLVWTLPAETGEAAASAEPFRRFVEAVQAAEPPRRPVPFLLSLGMVLAVAARALASRCGSGFRGAGPA